METFTQLQAWQTGMQLNKLVYDLVSKFPDTEKFGLVQQLQRASCGILANTAEGFSRSTNGDKAYKYTIARGECSEVHALLLVSTNVGLCSDEDITNLIELTKQTGQLLSGLIRRYSAKP